MVLSNKTYISLILFVLATSVYLPSLNNRFLWDDVALIEKSSSYLNELNIEKILIPRESNKKNLKYYRPTFQISMFTDYQIWGAKAFGYHLTNVLLFSISAVIFFLLSVLILKAFSIQGPEKYSFIGSLIFIAHPMHVESVSWIAGRTDILCAIFMGLAFIFHILSGKRFIYILAATVSFYLSLLSKELAVVFPLIVISFDLLSGKAKRKNIVSYIFYASILFTYLYIRSRSYINVPPVSKEITGSSNNATGAAINYFSLIKTFASSYLFYIYKITLPFVFNAYISHVPANLTYFISSVISILLISFISLVCYLKRKGIVTFAVLWIFITLGPSVMVAVLSIAAAPLAERYVFVPTMGFCLLGGYMFLLTETGSNNYKRSSLALLITILLIFTFLTIRRQGVWQDRLSLWKDTSEKSFYDAFPHSNYGKALQDNKQYELAISQYMTALDPEVDDTNRGRAITSNNLSLVYIETGQYSKAETWLKKALEYDPSYLLTYYHLGLINYIDGEQRNSRQSYLEAEQLLLKVIKKDRKYARAKLLIAKVYSSLGEIDKAVKYAAEARKGLNDRRLMMEADKIIKVNNKTGQDQP